MHFKWIFLNEKFVFWFKFHWNSLLRDGPVHYNDVIMSAMASQITSLYECLLNCLSRHRSKKISKLRVTGLCEGNSPVVGEFHTQRASNAQMFPFDDVIMWQRRLSSAQCQAISWANRNPQQCSHLVVKSGTTNVSPGQGTKPAFSQ